MSHVPVLLDESVQALALRPDGAYVDGTLGGAGHALAIARHLGPDGTLIGFDLDSHAVARARERLAEVSCGTVLVRENFRNLDRVLDDHHIGEVDGIFLDLGWSSFQIADAERGLSFQADGPLAMTLRDNPGKGDLTAWDIVNTWDEGAIADVLYAYGDERHARKIARAIVGRRATRPIDRTLDLADIVARAVPGGMKPWKSWSEGFGKKKTNPATRTFQALRIAVNDEYGAITDILASGFKRIAPGGRFAVITFHSGEDRIVKNAFRDLAHAGQAALLTNKPIMPSDAEVAENPRARSAQLRIIEKLPL